MVYRPKFDGALETMHTPANADDCAALFFFGFFAAALAGPSLRRGARRRSRFTSSRLPLPAALIITPYSIVPILSSPQAIHL